MYWRRNEGLRSVMASRGESIFLIMFSLELIDWRLPGPKINLLSNLIDR